MSIDQAMPLPWQTPIWSRFVDNRRDDRIAHAYLLAGPSGVGKRQLALAMAAGLLCQSPDDGLACGQCRSCRLRSAGSHPDYRLIEPEDQGGVLKIEAIRELIDYSHLTSQYGDHRVIILHPAEAMNRASANSLLKTLEEPPSGVVLILVSHNMAGLPVTIRSRCRIERCPLPDPAEAVDWLDAQGVTDTRHTLAAAGGAPLAAREMAEAGQVEMLQSLAADLGELLDGTRNPVELASRWQSSGSPVVLTWMQRLLTAARRQQFNAQDPGRTLPPGFGKAAVALSPRRLHAIEQKLQHLRAADRQPLAKELAMEALFLAWLMPEAEVE
jgi:DNA polymerase-3 subunit delta'